MEQKELAIHVDRVSKVYKLYRRNRDRLIESLGLTKKKLSTPHYALKDVSLDIYKGETVGIIGTNGSGKSTILKIITGVLHETSGTVQVNGRISALLELGAGFNMEYNGIENIYLNGTMIGFSEKEIDENYENLKLELSTIDAEFKSMAENAKNKNIIVTSDDLKVLSKYGLEITSIDEKHMTDKDLATAKSLLANKTVSYIFIKKGETESDTVKELKKTYNVKTLEIDTLNNISMEDKNTNKDYISLMNENMDNLKEELY